MVRVADVPKQHELCDPFDRFEEETKQFVHSESGDSEVPSSAKYQSQAGEDLFNVTVHSGSKLTSTENVTFMDRNPAWAYDVDTSPDPTFAAADVGDASLGSFLSRPVKIASYDWTVASGTLFEKINPWKAFCEDSRVLSRISNYNLLRMKLHIKVILNGNGFHYGRAIVSYNPLHTYDILTKTRTDVIQDRIADSIRPHIYLDPTSSLGGEMVLPFFFDKNALSIPGAEWDTMGELCFCSINNLKHANGASDNVRINVFAWAEDVSLSIPTTVAPTPAIAYTSQAGDEYGKPISGPATALANAAGALTKVPYIGLYARASQLALSGVAGVASLFGYCRPVITDPAKPVKPTFLGNLANTNVPDGSQKLTTDIKQEVTVDPRTTGLSAMDEMTIKSIASRESFLTTVPWVGSTASGTKLFTASVTPYNFDIHSTGDGQHEIHMTPACHVASLFENWRGSMRYRVQVVASNFHKGRLQIQYDPYTSNTSSFNSAYNRIIDISEEKDFTIEIGWGVQHPYCAAYEPLTRVPPFKIGSGNIAFPSVQPNRFNGQFSIWVLNELTTASDANADISLNIFVSAGDDMEFANPTAHVIDELVTFPTLPGPLTYTSQSAEQDSPAAEDTTEPSRPVQDADVSAMAADVPEVSHISDVCFGEKITTIRSLLKRFTASQICGVPTGMNILTQNRSDFPYYRGHATDAIHTSVSGPYNYVRNTPLNHLAVAFAGWRGGLRWKYQVVGTSANPNTPALMTATRQPFSGFSYAETSTAFPAKTSISTRASWIKDLAGGYEGQAATAVSVNPCLEVEYPYHHPYRFCHAKTNELNSYPNIEDYGSHILRVASASGDYSVVEYVAVADDFSLFFYLGPPVFYKESDNPATS